MISAKTVWFKRISNRQSFLAVTVRTPWFRQSHSVGLPKAILIFTFTVGAGDKLRRLWFLYRRKRPTFLVKTSWYVQQHQFCLNHLLISQTSLMLRVLSRVKSHKSVTKSAPDSIGHGLNHTTPTPVPAVTNIYPRKWNNLLNHNSSSGFVV